MKEKAIRIPMDGGTAEGFLYWPDGAGRLPGVLHLTDIFGIREANQGMAKRLAAKGYAVLLPNVFYRGGGPPLFDFPVQFGEAHTMKRIGELKDPLTPETMERDASAYVDFMAAQEQVNAGPMGVVGYCFTGGMALRSAAARADKIVAMASFHGGGLYTDDPSSPHRVLPRVAARLYFGHADQDRGMPKEAIEKFESALKAWDGAYTSETYKDALHGWTVPGSPVYNEAQAERAFEKLVQLFDRELRLTGTS
jgi:carboxymethylenebutenolidase